MFNNNNNQQFDLNYGDWLNQQSNSNGASQSSNNQNGQNNHLSSIAKGGNLSLNMPALRNLANTGGLQSLDLSHHGTQVAPVNNGSGNNSGDNNSGSPNNSVANTITGNNSNTTNLLSQSRNTNSGSKNSSNNGTQASNVIPGGLTAGLPFQNPYIMQLNQMAAQRANGGPNGNNSGNNGANSMLSNLPQMAPILAYDPNNPAMYNQANANLLANAAANHVNMNAVNALNGHQDLNTIQQMQMLILQEQQQLDVTLKDENPNDRFKRYQAAYAKILQHQSYSNQASLQQLSAANANQYSALNINLLNMGLNPMNYNSLSAANASLLSQTQNVLGFNPAAAVQALSQQQQIQQQAQQSHQPSGKSNNMSVSNGQNMDSMETSSKSRQPTINDMAMDTTSPTPNSLQQMLIESANNANIDQNTQQVSSANKQQTSSGKSNATDNTSVTGDSALGRSSTSGSIIPNQAGNESLQQSMTNSRAQQNRIKEGVVASAAQLTPGLFSNAENIKEFLGLAENPQIHVPCTAKCYHKCKLGISCPRHAHKHHERKLRKQRQAAQVAAAQAAANGQPIPDNISKEQSSTTKDQSTIKDSHKGCNKSGKHSQETSSSMSVCSDTFNNLDKKSGKDGKKRTFLDLYEVYNVIGVGGGGMVYSGRRIQDKLPVAIKRVMREKVKRWETVQGYQVPQEIALMLRCYGHPGIIKLVDWYECLDSFILIMERPERAVDLFDYIREIGRVPEKEAARIFKQILDAAIHIQNCGVVHRDIKDENIIINRDTMEAKLIDFGCGTLLKDGPYRDFSGTPEFYPPEWFVDREYYARTACVWSLGVLLFDMTQGEIPFKQKEKIVENKPNYKHPISENCRNLIQWCMNSNQKQRPTLEAIQMHMWVVLNCLQPNQAYGSLSQDSMGSHHPSHHTRPSGSTMTAGYPSHHGAQNQLQLNQQLSQQANQQGQLTLNNNLLNLNNLTQATAQSLAASQNINLGNLAAGNMPSNQQTLTFSAANNLGNNFNNSLNSIQQRLSQSSLQSVQNGIQNLTNQALQTINANNGSAHLANAQASQLAAQANFNTNQLMQAQLQAQIGASMGGPHQGMLHPNLISGNLLAAQQMVQNAQSQQVSVSQNHQHSHGNIQNIANSIAQQQNLLNQARGQQNMLGQQTQHSSNGSESNSNPRTSPSQSTNEMGSNKVE